MLVFGTAKSAIGYWERFFENEEIEIV